MKETGWKKTAGNGSDGKRTEGKKSFGRGEKTTGFSKNSAKAGSKREKQGSAKCPIYRECGGCQYLHLTYDQQLKEKQKRMEELLGGVCPVRPIIWIGSEK